MEFETPKSKVYIQTDGQGRILRCEGGYTTPADLTEEELDADLAAIPEPKPSKTVEARLTALEAEAEQAKADREALNILLGGAE